MPENDNVQVMQLIDGNNNVEYVPPLGLLETQTAMVDDVERETVVKGRSGVMAKWVEDESLWTDEDNNLEDHTTPTAIMNVGDQGIIYTSSTSRNYYIQKRLVVSAQSENAA